RAQRPPSRVARAGPRCAEARVERGSRARLGAARSSRSHSVVRRNRAPRPVGPPRRARRAPARLAGHARMAGMRGEPGAALQTELSELQATVIRGRSLRNVELEACLADNPDDQEALSVYADWLTLHGDVRGHFLRVQMERSKAPEDASLAQLESQLLREFAR